MAGNGPSDKSEIRGWFPGRKFNCCHFVGKMTLNIQDFLAEYSFFEIDSLRYRLQETLNTSQVPTCWPKIMRSKSQHGKKKTGFAAMSKEKRRKVAQKGGRAAAKARARAR